MRVSRDTGKVGKDNDMRTNNSYITRASRRCDCSDCVNPCILYLLLVRPVFQLLGWKKGSSAIPERLLTERVEIWGNGQFNIKFDPSLPEDHRANILSTADILRHHCKLGGGSASISGTSVYRGSKRGSRVVRRQRRANSDCPTTGYEQP